MAGTVIAILAHADDMLLMSHSPEGLQAKLDALEHWARVNFILINRVKTVIMAFGVPANTPLPIFFFASVALEYSVKEKYVGVVFSSTPRQNLLKQHYILKASTARYYAHSIWAVEDRIGSLSVSNALQQYMARVDCHLMHGADVMPDTQVGLLHKLRTVQLKYLRRSLRIHSSSMIVPLYTETGIMPIEVRRFLSTLEQMRYALACRPGHTARLAIESSRDLHPRGQRCYFGDVLKAARLLPFAEHLPFELDIVSLTPQYVSEYAVLVRSCLSDWLLKETENRSDKLYLLWGRLEPREKEKKPPAQMASCLRHYLLVENVDHRRAITDVMLSHHHLAIEEMRRTGQSYTPRHLRLCRLCESAVETPEHALLGCQGSTELTTLRAMVWVKLIDADPSLIEAARCQISETEMLKRIVYIRETIGLVAMFAYRVLKLFYDVPMYGSVSEVEVLDG